MSFDNLLNNPAGEEAKKYYADDISGDLEDSTNVWQLFAYALNNNRLSQLTDMVNNGLQVESFACYMFIAHTCPIYEVWKELAVALGVKPTYFFGGYDYDSVPFKFYADLIADLGKEEVLRAIKEDKHNYRCDYITGYVNQLDNEKALADALASTGLKCPPMKFKDINMSEH